MMIFTNLKLRNFKSHVNTSVDFNQGISIIVGENGAGKSTIFEAISFALFKQYTGKKINDLIRVNKNLNSNEKMAVDLSFISNGQEYKVSRERTNTSSKAKLLQKDINSGDYFTICSGDTEVNNEIQSILEMDSDLFLNAIYVRQGEIADLVGKTPSERKKLIGKLLKLEELEKAWKNSLPLLNDYENKKAELKGKISSDSELNYDLKSKKQELESLNTQGTEAEEELDSLNKVKDENAISKAQMETEKGIYDALKNNLNNEMDNLKAIIKDKRDLQNQVDEIARMEDEKVRLEKYSKKLPVYIEFSEAVKNIARLKEDEVKYKKIIEDITAHKEILESQREYYNEYLGLEGKIKALTDNKSKLESEIKLYDELESEKKKTEEELKNSENKIKSFFDEVKSALGSFISEDEFQAIVGNYDFDKLKFTVANIRKEISADLKTNEEKVKSVNKDLITLNEGITSSKKPLSELNTLANKCPICQSDISPSKKQELIISYNNTIEFNKKAIDSLNKDLENLSKTKKDLESKSIALENLEKNIYGNKHLSDTIATSQDKIEDLAKRLIDEENTKEKLKGLNSLIDTENKNRKDMESNYNKYIESQGALKTLGKEHEAKDALYKITGKMDIEVQRIKNSINSDAYLSTSIQEEELNAKIEDLKDKDRRYNQLKGSVRQKDVYNNKLEAKKEEIKWKKAKIEKIENDISTSKYDKEKFNKINFVEERTNNKIVEVNKTLGQIKGRVTEIIPIIESLTKTINENKRFKEELDNVEDYLALLNNIRELYGKDGVQKVLRLRSRPTIQKYTKDFFEQFNFNYSDLILDDDYNISLYGPEGEAKLDMVSGGERIAIALALRLGITQAMSKGNIETILLDEPTIHLDSYRRHELIDLLREMSVLPQMIIVTHDSELENAADNIIKIEKLDGISKVIEE